MAQLFYGLLADEELKEVLREFIVPATDHDTLA